jgi:hypothetical protein
MSNSDFYLNSTKLNMAAEGEINEFFGTGKIPMFDEKGVIKWNKR